MPSRSISLLLTVVALTGCASLFRSAPAGCEPHIKEGVGAITIAGLQVPIGATSPIKIGSATYTPQQVQRLTDSAQQMEQYRLGQCSVLSTLERLSPQPVDRIAQIADSIAKMNLELQRLFREVPVTKDPEKQVRETEAAASNVGKLKAPVQPITGSDKQSYSGDLRELFVQSQNLSATASQLLAKLRELPAQPSQQVNDIRPVELTVTGFSSGSHEMTTRMKANLLADLQSVLQNVPKGHSVAIDVIGYADTTGNQTRNITLAHKRAQHVASFIAEQQVLTMARLRSVTGGGAVEIAPFGRQVRVVLNPISYVNSFQQPKWHAESAA